MRLMSLLAPVAAILLCPAAAANAQERDFPDGPGKDVFVAVCGGCHEIGRARAGYTPEGWRTVMQMMKNVAAPVPADKWDVLTDYLIKSFPEKPRPAAAKIEGPQQANIKLWPVPTPGSRPHDPMAAKDGTIWYAGQVANKIGHFDPKTEQFKEFPLKTPRTGPHGLAEDRDGNIWFTGNSAGLIGKLDPKTGNVTEYKMPDPAVKDPHTLNFDQSGMLWFTAQNANVMGRLDPKTGDIKIIKSLTPNSRPYGLHVNSKGVPVVVLFGTNKIATIDPD